MPKAQMKDVLAISGKVQQVIRVISNTVVMFSITPRHKSVWLDKVYD